MSRRFMYAEAVAVIEEAGGVVIDPDPDDPFDGKPWGEQQEQVDWLESRYDDQYESENDYYDGPDYD